MYDMLICDKCNVPLETKKAGFAYLAHHFFAELPRCPVCGQIYVPEDLVRGKIAEVEKHLEEK